MRKAFPFLLATAICTAACSTESGAPLNGAPLSVARGQAIAPADFSLHPPRIRFASPQQHYKIERVRGFGENGSIAEDCIEKGVAEVAGDGLHGNTLIADVIPMAPGRCTATFTNGNGAKLTLPIRVL